MPLAIPVLTPEESADWDIRAAEAGTHLETLMESAGRAVVAVIADRFGYLLRRGVLVAAGPGNNGGDGWVIARALHRLDVPVWVVSPPGEEASFGAGWRRVPWPTGCVSYRPTALALIAACGRWLLGTGARGAPRPPMAALLGRLVDLDIPIIAVDGPTGVDLLTGHVHDVPRICRSLSAACAGVICSLAMKWAIS